MKLFTTTIGDGPRTAALLHGASMTHDIWRDFGRILVDTYDLRLLLVDQRGHGQSPRSTAYAIEDYIADAVENLPTGLDFLIGQSLGGRVGAEASEALRPKRYIGLDPAFTVTKPYAVLLEHVAPHQARFPTWLLKAMGSPPKTAAPDTLDRIRAAWAKWDPSMMKQLVACRTPGFVPAPPAVAPPVPSPPGPA
ncbi:MAG TPA: alpha/beta hydrolase, partial [Phycicoccus sp.]|nr:alpha/beta hydrolase [Phycicoccus sp.]